MSAAENIVTTMAPAPSCEPIELDLVGSKDLRRILQVSRSRYGQVSIYVRPQRPKSRKELSHGWYRGTAAASVSPRDIAETVAIRYHDSGPSLWIGPSVWFDLLPAEADELVGRFGFRVIRKVPAP